MKQKIFCLLVVFGLFSSTLMAATIKLKISGSGTALGDPAQPWPLATSWIGSGSVGGASSQGIWMYAPLTIGSDGKARLTVVDGQLVVRFDDGGDTLLVSFNPGNTGSMQITDPVAYSGFWKQHWTGQIVGGTGDYATAKGTVKVNCTGVFCMTNPTGTMSNALMMAFAGSVEITLQED